MDSVYVEKVHFCEHLERTAASSSSCLPFQCELWGKILLCQPSPHLTKIPAEIWGCADFTAVQRGRNAGRRRKWTSFRQIKGILMNLQNAPQLDSALQWFYEFKLVYLPGSTVLFHSRRSHAVVFEKKVWNATQAAQEVLETKTRAKREWILDPQSSGGRKKTTHEIPHCFS